MEVVAPILIAAVSSAVSSAVPKLARVIPKLVGRVQTDAIFIKDELLCIQETIRKHYFIRSECIAQLRRLAYDIEDCIDCFQVKKTSPQVFAEEIAGLKTRSEDTRKRLSDYIQIDRGLQDGMQQLMIQVQGQRQQQLIAPATVLEVPHELQELLGRQGEDWYGNLNCLLYFCMFPHDHHARRNPLIRRWLAEGLVGGEDDAVKYLKAFIDGKIINTTAKSNNGMMKRCHPPVDILSFIYKQSRATNFMLFCDDMARLQAECARRLSFHYPNDDMLLDDMNWPDFSHLHTLAVFHGNANPDSYEAILKFGKYEVLRVLDLKECAPLSEGHLLAICKLLLLKYLSFKGGSGIDRLPSEIGKLPWLETLDMRGSEIVTVHKEILMMPRLKHLLGKFQLSRRDAISWTVRDFMTTELGKFLKNKSVLETLSGFVTGGRRGFPQLMILMRKLRKVKIWCKSNASEANLGDISSAITKFIRDGSGEPEQRLSLSINFQECSGQFLNNLQVEGALTSLKLHGNLSEFPQFVARLTIVELCLSSTALTWNAILAGLSKLRILKYLKLVEDNLGHVEILAEHLRSLERLCLVCEPNLDIAIKADALPGLVSLHIICQDLDVLPGTPNMEIIHMTNLQEVGLHSQVDQAIKQGWKNAAEAHPYKPRVFDVPTV